MCGRNGGEGRCVAAGGEQQGAGDGEAQPHGEVGANEISGAGARFEEKRGGFGNEMMEGWKRG